MAVRFEDILSKFDGEDKGGLSLSDILRMAAANRNLWDPIGGCVRSCSSCLEAAGKVLLSMPKQPTPPCGAVVTVACAALHMCTRACLLVHARLASLGEWWLLWLIAADPSGVVSREKIRGCFDGTLFYRIAEERRLQQDMKYE